VAHFLHNTNETGKMFYNRQVLINAAVAPHYLLTRFALAMFPFVADMFGTNRNRLVRLRAHDEGNRDIKEKVLELPGDIIAEMVKNKTSGTKKRKFVFVIPGSAYIYILHWHGI
jgi:hypothetical protein